MSHSNSQRGVTLVELCVSISVLAILLAVALPVLEQMRLRQRVQLTAQMVMNDLQQARSEAVVRGESVNFRVSQHPQGSCYLIHSGPTNACRCSDSGQAVCTGAGEMQKLEWLPASRKVKVQANVSSMRFQARQGAVTSTGSIEIAASTGQSIRQIVSIAGRVRTCSPQAAFNGMPRCG